MRKSESKSKISSSSKGFLVILSAPSGCGKTTILTRLLQRHPEWVRSISVTTRSPRPGEKRGRDYRFVTPREFESLKRKQEFLEWARVFGECYGTPKGLVQKEIANRRTVLLAIDVQGTRKVRRALRGKAPFFSVFVLPPSVVVLRERLEGRKTESAEEIERRIRKAEEEIKAAKEYDATVINHDLGQTVREIEARIEKFEQQLKGGK